MEIIIKKQEKVFVAIVDDEDYNKVASKKWYVCSYGYAYTPINRKKVPMHKIIMGAAPDGLVTDHKNRNKLDNRKENLRFVTQAQNARNRSAAGKSGHLGVSYYKRKRNGVEYKYIQAHIWVDGKNKFLGHFDTEREASEAYKRTAVKLFGEYASV